MKREKAILCGLLAAGLVGCGTAPGPESAPGPRPAGLFRDITTAAGVRFTHHTGFVKPDHPNLLQTTGAGCAMFDYDSDGKLDLYLVDGLHPEAGGNHLYRNRGDGTFEDVTDRAGVRGHGYGMGCAVGDYDGDGDPDLYVTHHGTNLLYRNNGNGTFTDVARQAGVEAGGWSTAAAFFDADGDGKLDLYVGRYVKFTDQSKQLCEAQGFAGACPPVEYPAEPDLFYRNRGDGTFAEATQTAGLRENTGRALGVLVDDYDGDRRPDVYVANDGSADFLYHNEGGGRFREVAVPTGVAYGAGGKALASMGCDWGDYDADGRLDLVIGTFQAEPEGLFRGLAGGLFVDAAAQAGLAGPTARVLTFGVGFLDYDRDGDLDLSQANGHIQPILEKVDPDAPFRQPRQLFENLGNGTFRDASAAAGPDFTALSVGRGMAFGDWDNDGDTDLLVSNSGLPATLLRNDTTDANHWLGVRLVHPQGEARVLGARVTVEAGGNSRSRYARVAYSFASANDPRVFFGLGAAPGPVKLSVQWPDGSKTGVTSVAVDRYVTVGPEGLVK